jgi:hypothetical protein
MDGLEAAYGPTTVGGRSVEGMEEGTPITVNRSACSPMPLRMTKDRTDSQVDTRDARVQMRSS